MRRDGFKKKSESFWRDGLTIDETRFSVFIILLVVGFAYSLYDHYLNGDIAFNLLELVKILIYAVAGINIAAKVSESLSKQRQESREYREYKREYEDEIREERERKEKDYDKYV